MRKRWLMETRLEKRLKTDERITLMALGNVKNELLAYLNKRKDIEILRMETRYIKNERKEWD